MQTDLEFPSGVEFLQALHGLLSVHHRRHCGPLLGEGRRQGGAAGEEGDERTNRVRFRRRRKKKTKRNQLIKFFVFSVIQPLVCPSWSKSFLGVQ